MSKLTAILATALALVAGGLVGHHLAHLGDAGARAASSPKSGIRVATAPRLGRDDAPVIVVEFSDFQCPACGHAEPTVRELRAEFGDRVQLQWRNLPLVEMHPDAHLAAEAAMAAGAQGRFWEMHDRLFADQRHLDRASLERDAAAIGLDLPRFRYDLDTHAFAAAVDADAALATRLGVTGTPTFFVDGQRIARWDLDLLPAVARAVSLARN